MIVTEKRLQHLRRWQKKATEAAALKNKGRKLTGKRLESARKSISWATTRAAEVNRGRALPPSQLEKLKVSQRLATEAAAIANRGKGWSEEKRRKFLANWDPTNSCKAAAKSHAKRSRKNRSGLEKIAARVLRKLGLRFQSQKVFGLFSVDFYLKQNKVALECDSEYWHNLPGARNRDKRKDQLLRSKGIQVARVRAASLKTNPETAIINAIRRAR